jgi:hypothetical protein
MKRYGTVGVFSCLRFLWEESPSGTTPTVSPYIILRGASEQRMLRAREYRLKLRVLLSSWVMILTRKLSIKRVKTFSKKVSTVALTYGPPDCKSSVTSSTTVCS